MAVLALNTGLIPLAARAATRRTATKRVVAPKVRPRRDATRRRRTIATADALKTIDRDDARRANERQPTTRDDDDRSRARDDVRTVARRRDVAIAVGRTRASRHDRSIGAARRGVSLRAGFAIDRG